MDEEQHRALALRALGRLRRVAVEEAFALDALASPDDLVQGVIEVLRAVEMTASATERAGNDLQVRLASERERLQ